MSGKRWHHGGALAGHILTRVVTSRIALYYLIVYSGISNSSSIVAGANSCLPSAARAEFPTMCILWLSVSENFVSASAMFILPPTISIVISRTLANYFVWHTVSQITGYLTKDILATALELDKVESGLKGLMWLWTFKSLVSNKTIVFFRISIFKKMIHGGVFGVFLLILYLILWFH